MQCGPNIGKIVPGLFSTLCKIMCKVIVESYKFLDFNFLVFMFATKVSKWQTIV